MTDETHANRKMRIEKLKKKREHTKKGQMLRRKEAIRAKQKYEKQIEKDVIQNRPKLTPITNEAIAAKKDSVQEQLEENMKILKALEEEYEKEMASKKQLNEGLEAQGHSTLQDKMDAINKQAIEDLRRLESGHKSGNYGEFENSLMKNWELEKEAKEAFSSENAGALLKEAQKSTASSLSDFFGGSASCVAKDKNGNVLHTSGLPSRKLKGMPQRRRQKKT